MRKFLKIFLIILLVYPMPICVYADGLFCIPAPFPLNMLYLLPSLLGEHIRKYDLLGVLAISIVIYFWGNYLEKRGLEESKLTKLTIGLSAVLIILLTAIMFYLRINNLF